MPRSSSALLDQVTYEELCNLIGVGYHGTIHLSSVSKPETHDENGPQGFSANLTDITGSAVTLCAYTDENIMAATWNVELMEEIGEHIGEDGLWAGYSGLYGPAMNTHRTAYAGRNFEYYSEDGFGVSDYTSSSYATSAHARGTYDGLLGVLAGTDTFDSSSTTTQAYQLLVYNAADPAVNDVHLVLAMREAAHRILYTVANSNAMNENGVIVSAMNWWQFSLIDGIIFSALAALVFLALSARDIVRFKKKNKA